MLLFKRAALLALSLVLASATGEPDSLSGSEADDAAKNHLRGGSRSLSSTSSFSSDREFVEECAKEGKKSIELQYQFDWSIEYRILEVLVTWELVNEAGKVVLSGGPYNSNDVQVEESGCFEPGKYQFVQKLIPTSLTDWSIIQVRIAGIQTALFKPANKPTIFYGGVLSSSESSSLIVFARSIE